MLAAAGSWWWPTPAWGEEPWRFATAARVVAFADVHGAYDELVGLLRATGVIDAELRWNGGDQHVVSLGDVLDRGPGSRAVLDLLMRLQREAEGAGGRLHVVLGNHEVMNLQGDWRYVTPADYAAFAADESDAQRAAAYAAFAAAAAGGDTASARSRFDAEYPRGFFARRAAFAPTGAYGAWLMSLPAIVVINDTAYVHGGLPRLVAEDADGLNERVHANLARYFMLRDSLAARGVLSAIDPRRDFESARALPPTADAALRAERDELLALADAAELGLDGPLWYRGSVYCKPLLEEPTLDAGLAALGVARVVVGHTPTPDRRARALHGGKLVTLDTGMLAERYGGRPAALLVDGPKLEIQYAAPPERSALASGRAVAYARTAAELRTALEQGEVD
ncbi:MAG TPA: metallophosphoesterase, partial [Gammaproteobacteria bacterium]|nr:metallophosphoesterase [Gammaproteobacteria bacterium]